MTIRNIIAAFAFDPQAGIQSALDPAGPQAARIEWLWWLMFWISVAVFIAVIAVLTGAVARRRRLQATPIPPVLHTPEDGPTVKVVTGAVGVTLVILFVLLVVSVVAAKYSTKALESKNPISIQVTGHQWWWEVRYPSTQADQMIVTANEIHIPVGVPVVINTASRDVIHSFWAPNVHGKRDLIPGYSSAFWFQADRPGIYRGQCAEFCGLQHAHMSFYLVAESREQFEQWKQQQLKSAPDPDNESRSRGKAVFEQGTCSMCHTIRGTAANAGLGPDLTHLASRKSIGAGTLPNSRGNLAGWIVDAQHIKPGVRMPPNPLSAEDLNALLDYLETLQ